MGIDAKVLQTWGLLWVYCSCWTEEADRADDKNIFVPCTQCIPTQASRFGRSEREAGDKRGGEAPFCQLGI